MPLQQRVPSIAQDQGSPLAMEGWRNALIIGGEARLRELQFQFRQNLLRVNNPGRPLSDSPRHLQQNAAHLGLFFFYEANQFVVLLDRLEGFDKHGLPAGARTVHDAVDAPLLFGLDRNHETLAPDG